MGMKNALEAALNNVANDGESWTAGWDEFFRQLGEEDATLSEAIDAALETANDGRSLPAPWLSATRGKFFALSRRSTRRYEEPEAGNEEGDPSE